MTGTCHVKFTNLLTHQYAQSCGMQRSMLELLVDGYRSKEGFVKG